MIAHPFPATPAVRRAPLRAKLAGAWLALAAIAFAASGAWPREVAAQGGAPGGEAVVPAAAKPVAPREAPTGGTLRVFNRAIFTFRSPLYGVPPPERATRAQARIMALLERGQGGVVTSDTEGTGRVVKIDGSLAFIVAEADVDALSGETLATASAAAVEALKLAIAETREARSGQLMLAAALWAGGATVVYLVLLWLLRLGGIALRRRLLRLAEETAEHFRIGGAEILHRARTIRVVRRLQQIVFLGLALLLTYEWVGFVLSRFPFTRPWGEQLNTFLASTTLGMLAAIAQAVPELLIAAVIFFVARGVNGMLQGFFEGVQSGRVKVSWLDADSARPTRQLASVAVWVFALVMAYPYIPGSDTEAFKGLSVLLGLMVSIGASGIVGQAASGLILMYTRTFRPGEYVRVADHEGTIVVMGMFTTRVRTGLGEELTLPNSLVLGAVTKNYSRAVQGRGFVLDTAVTIGYDVPWRQVHAMLIEAARRTDGVLSEPAPHVYQTALSDFYVEYRLVCQAIQSEPRPRALVLSVLHGNVQDVFNEHGVQIMSPHYLGDPAEPKVVPPAKWHAAPAVPPAAPPPGRRVSGHSIAVHARRANTHCPRRVRRGTQGESWKP